MAEAEGSRTLSETTGPLAPETLVAGVARTLGFRTWAIPYVGGVAQLPDNVPAELPSELLPWTVLIPDAAAKGHPAVFAVLDDGPEESAAPTGNRVDFVPLDTVLSGPWWADSRGFVHIGQKPEED